MHIDDFDFDLPRELIALHPCEPRDAARLLVIPASGGFEDRRISDLPALLHPGDLLVFNDTKVIPARLTGRRGPAVVEVTLYRDLGFHAVGIRPNYYADEGEDAVVMNLEL